MQNLLQREPEVSDAMETKAVVRSFRKIRRRWIASLAAMFFVVPVVFLSINQVRGAGICYTNVDEIFLAGRFVKALERSDFQKALEMMDFENVYCDIQEALAIDVEDYMPDLVPITIGGSGWMIRKDLYQKYSGEEIQEKFWETAIFQNTGFLIPVDIWDTAVSRDPNAFVETEDGVYIEGEIADSGEPYICLETKWGTYMVRQNSGLEDCETAADFCTTAGLIPVGLYQDGQKELEVLAEEEYQSTQEYYAEVSDMVPDEFCELMRERHGRQLNAYAESGFDFKSTGYEKSKYEAGENCWEITYGIEVSCQGETYPASIECRFSGHKIVYLWVHWDRDFSEGNMLSEALSMYYMR